MVVAGEVVVGDTPEQGIMIKEYQKTSKNLVSAQLVAILAVVTLIKDCYKIWKSQNIFSHFMGPTKERSSERVDFDQFLPG